MKLRTKRRQLDEEEKEKLKAMWDEWPELPAWKKYEMISEQREKMWEIEKRKPWPRKMFERILKVLATTLLVITFPIWIIPVLILGYIDSKKPGKPLWETGITPAEFYARSYNAKRMFLLSCAAKNEKEEWQARLQKLQALLEERMETRGP